MFASLGNLGEVEIGFSPCLAFFETHARARLRRCHKFLGVLNVLTDSLKIESLNNCSV